jgi:HD superfamily phosphohydrolase
MHGSIPFNEREARIIDHPLYQRLRAISQLGFSSLVYPGATHTRFSHGLGVMLLAGRIFDQIVASLSDPLRRQLGEGELEYYRQIVRFAGLLHDVGHLPFSHTFEPLLPELEKLPVPRDWYARPDTRRRATHEDYSVAAVYALSEEAAPLLSAQEARDVAALINEHVTPAPTLTGAGNGAAGNVFPLLKQIISGEIDADRMDYLRRDAHFAGVAYGYFDQDRLIQGLTCVATPEGLMMALDHNALYAYENFLMTRFHMAMQVYLHKTVLLFDHYLRQAIEEGEITCPLDRDLDSFLAARDDVIMARLHEARHRRWAGRIVRREPFSRLIQLTDDTEAAARTRIPAALQEAGIEHIHIREERRLSNLGVASETQAFPVHVYEERLGEARWRPLHEVSVLLERYNQVFVIENIYCPQQGFAEGVEVVRALGL